MKQFSFPWMSFSLLMNNLTFIYLVSHFCSCRSIYPHHTLPPLFNLSRLYVSKQINNVFLSSPLRLWFIAGEINATMLLISDGVETQSRLVTHYRCGPDESAANPSRDQPGQLHMKHPGQPERYCRSENLRSEQVRIDWSNLNEHSDLWPCWQDTNSHPSGWGDLNKTSPLL